MLKISQPVSFSHTDGIIFPSTSLRPVAEISYRVGRVGKFLPLDGKNHPGKNSFCRFLPLVGKITTKSILQLQNKSEILS